MWRISIVLSLNACSYLVSMASAQKAIALNAPASDIQATAIVAAALNAMGGQAAWTTIADVTATGICTLETTNNTEPSSAQPFRWINAGKNFRYEPNSGSPGYSMISGQNKPSVADAKGTRLLTPESAMVLAQPYYLPGLMLLRDLTDRHFTLEHIGQESFNGVSTVHVRVVKFEAGTQQKAFLQDWWFDSGTHLPVKLGYLIPGQTTIAYMPLVKVYSNWSSEGSGVLAPLVVATMTNQARPLRTCTVSLLEFNTQPNEALFTRR